MVREPANNICDLNLRTIQFAKHRLAHDKNLKAGDRCPIGDLNTYIPLNLQCPDGGIYFYDDIGFGPVCTIFDHPEPSIYTEQR